MRSITHSLELAHESVGAEQASAHVNWEVTTRPLERGARRHSVSRAVGLVGLLAFGQSLVFLALWLLVCASAGAATVSAKKVDFTPDLALSTYAPSKGRDPFAKLGGTVTDGKVVAATPSALQLEGILFHSTNPSAIVNGQLLLLDKTVNLTTEAGTVPVKAVSITRERVVLEAGGQKIELRLSPQ